jgi:hypothetical protein
MAATSKSSNRSHCSCGQFQQAFLAMTARPIWQPQSQLRPADIGPADIVRGEAASDAIAAATFSA